MVIIDSLQMIQFLLSANESDHFRAAGMRKSDQNRPIVQVPISVHFLHKGVREIRERKALQISKIVERQSRVPLVDLEQKHSTLTRSVRKLFQRRGEQVLLL